MWSRLLEKWLYWKLETKHCGSSDWSSRGLLTRHRHSLVQPLTISLYQSSHLSTALGLAPGTFVHISIQIASEVCFFLFEGFICSKVACPFEKRRARIVLPFEGLYSPGARFAFCTWGSLQCVLQGRSRIVAYVILYAYVTFFMLRLVILMCVVAPENGWTIGFSCLFF